MSSLCRFDHNACLFHALLTFRKLGSNTPNHIPRVMQASISEIRTHIYSMMNILIRAIT